MGVDFQQKMIGAGLIMFWGLRSFPSLLVMGTSTPVVEHAILLSLTRPGYNYNPTGKLSSEPNPTGNYEMHFSNLNHVRALTMTAGDPDSIPGHATDFSNFSN